MVASRPAPVSHGEPLFRLPNVGPDPIPLERALAAVLGYAPGTTVALAARSLGVSQGRWVSVPAFGWSRFDIRPVARRSGHPVAEGLHGRRNRGRWHDVHDAPVRVRPSADAATDCGPAVVAGAALDEVSVLGEPGSVRALLSEIGRTSGSQPGHVAAALPTDTRVIQHPPQDPPRVAASQGRDSGVEAVVWRELQANVTARRVGGCRRGDVGGTARAAAAARHSAVA